MSRLLVLLLALAALGISACGGDDDEDASGDTATEAADTGAAEEEPSGAGGEEGGSGGGSGGGGKPGVTIATGDSQFGSVLFDGDDQAIYYFDKEKTSESECYDDCASAWPPVLTRGDPKASAGAEQRLLGTTDRDDGTTQVTYDGHPLYYYVDEGPGEVLCHNISEFGGLWLAVQPDGAAVPT